MKIVPMTAACLIGLAFTQCFAADALHPYSNIDHRVDAGNNTGDSQVDALNAAQLGQGSAAGTYRRVPGIARIYPRAHVMPSYPPPPGTYAAPAPYGWAPPAYPPPYPY